MSRVSELARAQAPAPKVGNVPPVNGRHAAVAPIADFSGSSSAKSRGGAVGLDATGGSKAAKTAEIVANRIRPELLHILSAVLPGAVRSLISGRARLSDRPPPRSRSWC